MRPSCLFVPESYVCRILWEGQVPLSVCCARRVSTCDVCTVWSAILYCWQCVIERECDLSAALERVLCARCWSVPCLSLLMRTRCKCGAAGDAMPNIKCHVMYSSPDVLLVLQAHHTPVLLQTDSYTHSLVASSHEALRTTSIAHTRHSQA